MPVVIEGRDPKEKNTRTLSVQLTEANNEILTARCAEIKESRSYVINQLVAMMRPVGQKKGKTDGPEADTRDQRRVKAATRIPLQDTTMMKAAG
jgi:hypothetical protein